MLGWSLVVGARGQGATCSVSMRMVSDVLLDTPRSLTYTCVGRDGKRILVAWPQSATDTEVWQRPDGVAAALVAKAMTDAAHAAAA